MKVPEVELKVTSQSLAQVVRQVNKRTFELEQAEAAMVLYAPEIQQRLAEALRNFVRERLNEVQAK